MNHLELCKALWNQKAIVDELKEKLGGEIQKFESLKRDVVKLFETSELTKQHINGYGTVYVQTNWSVRVPKDTEKKIELFNYIDQKKGGDVLLNFQTIHSATLNAFYEGEFELAKKRGEHRWVLPGVGEPENYKTVGMRKG